jgi:hypothetical protein
MPTKPFCIYQALTSDNPDGLDCLAPLLLAGYKGLPNATPSRRTGMMAAAAFAGPWEAATNQR